MRRVIRFTIIRGLNDMPEMAVDWAKIIRKANPEFLEIKSYMHIGMSRQRLNRENMLLHPEVKAFAEKIAEASGYKYSNESVLGRIVLLVRPDLEGKSTKIVFNSA